MNESDPKKQDEPVEEILRLLACSELRNNLAKALRNGQKMTLSELSEKVGASSPAAVHALRELGKEQITHQDEKRNYALTNIGEIVTRRFQEVNTTITALTRNRDFWITHNLSDIPNHLLDKIGCLADTTILTSAADDLFKVWSSFYMLLENSKYIRGISPIFTGDLTPLFERLASRNIDIELIFTPAVLEATLKTVDRKELALALEKNLKIFTIKKQPNFASTVTDYFLFMGFFRPDGLFDWTNGLLSQSPEALEWGRELYQYYAEKAEPVRL